MGHFESLPVIHIFDAKGDEIRYQRTGQALNRTRFRTPATVFPQGYKVHQVQVSLPVQIPALGYTTLTVRPGWQGEPVPFLPQSHIRRYAGNMSSVDLGRGCPYQCSFCTIINVQGRKSRRRSADDVERIVRENAKQGILRAVSVGFAPTLASFAV